MQDVESNANALKGVSNQLLVDLDIDPDDIADGERWKMPATIDDPIILDEISSALQTLGYANQAR